MLFRNPFFLSLIQINILFSLIHISVDHSSQIVRYLNAYLVIRPMNDEVASKRKVESQRRASENGASSSYCSQITNTIILVMILLLIFFNGINRFLLHLRVKLLVKVPMYPKILAARKIFQSIFQIFVIASTVNVISFGFKLHLLLVSRKTGWAFISTLQVFLLMSIALSFSFMKKLLKVRELRRHLESNKFDEKLKIELFQNVKLLVDFFSILIFQVISFSFPRFFVLKYVVLFGISVASFFIYLKATYVD